MAPLTQIVEKAHRLHDDGQVRELDCVRVFQVDGDHGTYRVVTQGSAMWCSCPAEGACSHIGAAALAMKVGQRDA